MFRKIQSTALAVQENNIPPTEVLLPPVKGVPKRRHIKEIYVSNRSENERQLYVLTRRQNEELNVSNISVNVKQLPLIKRRQIKKLNVSKTKTNVKQLL